MEFRSSLLPGRFWAKVSVEPSGCWLWTASVDRDGYGMFRAGGRMRGAHRVSYEILAEPIAEGLVLDHLCRVRHCVNPAHLEPVTDAENILRGDSPSAVNATKTHCANGHPFDEPNTYTRYGRRFCRACNRAAAQRQRERRAAS